MRQFCGRHITGGVPKMFACKILVSLALLVQLSLYANAATDKVVCYWGTWAVYRPGNGKFQPEDIDPKLCTHAIYTFVGLNTDGTVKLLDADLDIRLKGFERFNALKKINPKLKTILAIGGWNEGSTKYSTMAASPQLRRNLINSAVEHLKKYGFDGFDVDWEYPNQRGGKPEDKANFVTLLKEFREEFNKHGFLLTAAVAAAAPSVDLSYDVPGVSKYLDFINVMAYDLHGPWDQVTGINGPLYPHPTDVTPAQKELNVEACINAWIKRGAAPEKIILGMGTYGHSYSLANTSNTEIGAPIWGPGEAGPYTRQAGVLGYNEICEYHMKGGWTTKWSEEQKCPYTYKGNQWAGYDNVESFVHKIQYAKTRKLGGLMIWSVETDDFKGVCGPKYPLLTAINKNLFGTQ